MVSNIGIWFLIILHTTEIFRVETFWAKGIGIGTLPVKPAKSFAFSLCPSVETYFLHPWSCQCSSPFLACSSGTLELATCKSPSPESRRRKQWQGLGPEITIISLHSVLYVFAVNLAQKSLLFLTFSVRDLYGRSWGWILAFSSTQSPSFHPSST